MVELQPSKLTTRVRFPSSALQTGNAKGASGFCFGLLAQWIEPQTSNLLIEVRFLYGLFSGRFAIQSLPIAWFSDKQRCLALWRADG